MTTSSEGDQARSGVVRGDLTEQVGTFAWIGNGAAALERTRRARLARWQQGTGNERDGQRRQRQTPATRAQDERSAPSSHNSSAA